MVEALNDDLNILRNNFDSHRDHVNLKLLQLEDIENQLSTKASDFNLRMIKVENGKNREEKFVKTKLAPRLLGGLSLKISEADLNNKMI